MPIHYEADGEHVVRITIDRPEARNSCDMEHFKLLREAWERFAADDDAWVAIITGVGEAFFSGADLKKYIPEITKFQKQIADEGLTEIDGYRLDDGTRAVLRNWPLYKPIIAAVNGFCTAGGMEMLGGSDIRIACPEAKFAVMEPKRGLFAGGGTTVRLPRQIPWPQAMEFLLCADLIPADRALRDGLAQRGRAARRSCSTRPASTRRASSPTRRSRCRRRSRARCRASTSTRTRHAQSARRGEAAARPRRRGRRSRPRSSRSLDALRKELRTPFEKESRISRRSSRPRTRRKVRRRSPRSASPVWQAR